MPPGVAFEATEMFKCFKKVSRIASLPYVQFLASYTFAKRGFTTYAMYVFATCKFATSMFSPPNMIKVVLKCTWLSTFKRLIYTVYARKAYYKISKNTFTDYKRNGPRPNCPY